MLPLPLSRCPFYPWEKGDFEKLYNFPRVTQLEITTPDFEPNLTPKLLKHHFNAEWSSCFEVALGQSHLQETRGRHRDRDIGLMQGWEAGDNSMPGLSPWWTRGKSWLCERRGHSMPSVECPVVTHISFEKGTWGYWNIQQKRFKNEDCFI